MIYGYARVSTKGQAHDGNSLKGQIETLKSAGTKVVFHDSFTGKELDRPEFNKLLESISLGDKLIVTKLDRFARSVAQGSQLIEALIKKGVTVHVLNIGVMDSTPTGKLIRNIMLSFAEFERDMIIERTQEGKAIARDKGIRVDGRPKKNVPISILKKFLKKQKGGKMTVNECCKRLDISRSTWYNLSKKVAL